LRLRNTSAAFGYWNALIWTKPSHGRAKASSPSKVRSKCGRYSSSPPRTATEQQTSKNRQKQRTSDGGITLRAQGPLREKRPLSGGNPCEKRKLPQPRSRASRY